MEVRDLKLRGVRSVDAGELRRSLATQPSACRSLLLRPFCLLTKSRYVFERRELERAELERDVLRTLVFYFKRGYRDAEVDTSITAVGDNAVRVMLTVREGPPTLLTASIVDDSARVVPSLDSARELRPRTGELLNLLAIDSTVIRLRERLWERGFADADIRATTTVDSAANTGTLRIDVDPRRTITIGHIAVEGEERISESTIRRSLFVAPGDVFRLSSIGRSQRALYESSLFRSARIDTLPRPNGHADTVMALVVHVKEAPQREARTSVGFTTADFVQAEGRFTHNYLFNGPRRFDLSLTVGNLLAQQLTKSAFFVDFTNIARDDDNLGRYYAPTYQASADLRQRWFGSARNTLGAGMFTHRRSSPGVFVDRGYGASASFTRELAARTPLSAIYRFEISRVEAGDVYFCVNFGVCDGLTISALRGGQRLSPLATTLLYDRTNAPFSPTRGLRASAEAEHASSFTASNFRYNRAVAEIAGFYPLKFRGTIGAARLRAGWVGPLSSTADAVGILTNGNDLTSSQILHPRKRFYAGGSQSVRGFGENQLGPRVLTIDPDVLRGRTVTDGAVSYACAPSVPITQCSVNAPHLRDRDFQVRPLGGTTLLEGSVELRIPVWGALVGAVFVDGAILGEASLGSITTGSAAVTPGFGVRYESPVGPIRVDLGLRPTLRRAIPVISQVTDSTGQRTLVRLGAATECEAGASGCRTFPDPEERKSTFRRIVNRLTLHLSIGQAF